MGTIAGARSRRQAGVLIAAALVVATVGGVFVAWSQARSTGDAEAPEGERYPVMVSTGEWGFHIEMWLTIDDATTLVRGSFSVEGESSRSTFYNDTSGLDVTRWRMVPVDAGDLVLAQASITPDCGRLPAATPVLTVTSRSEDGTETTKSLGTSNSAEYRRQVDKWCSQRPKAALSFMSLSPAGELKGTITIANPGPESVVVTMGELSAGDAHWHPARVTVPGGGDATMAIRATGVRCRPTPWTKGLLRADGQPIPIAYGEEVCSG